MDLANKAFIPEDAFRVLVVEDNEINQSLITVILNRMSLQVDCAPDGLTGVELAAATHYDLVIMDVQMPRLDGIEATRRIRALTGGSSRAPIIALTADAEGTQRERCLAAGMTEVLAKPIVPPLLIATVTRLLQKRKDVSITVTVPPLQSSAD
jgi:CheY-like chemotaxis protein